MSNIEEQSAVRKFLEGIDGPVIVELGAHVGEEYAWLSEFRPSKYIMVEPDPENCKRIRAECPGVTLLECAVSARNGPGVFYQAVNHKAHNRASGSTRRPTGHLKYFPEVEFSEATEVRHKTLDAISEERMIGRIDLLWVDIQGAELDMITEGRRTLEDTRYMMIEAEPDVELYEGQALKPEIISLLTGWKIVKDFDYNLLMRNTQCA